MIDDPLPSDVPMDESQLDDSAVDRLTTDALKPFDFSEDSASSDSEVLGQLKAEFEEFVERTLQRLHSVSEALDALNCDYFPDSNQKRPSEPTLGTPRESFNSTGTHGEDAGESLMVGETEKQSFGDTAQAHSCLNEAESQARLCCLENQLDADVVAARDTLPTSDNVTGSHWITGDEGVAAPTMETQPSGSTVNDDDDSDLSERLNAIKSRLAKQIENS